MELIKENTPLEELRDLFDKSFVMDLKWCDVQIYHKKSAESGYNGGLLFVCESARLVLDTKNAIEWINKLILSKENSISFYCQNVNWTLYFDKQQK